VTFDYEQRGYTTSHRYRGYYDSGSKTTACEQCGRLIRLCYSLHDRNMKSFVIGSCCFKNYADQPTLIQLRAARLLLNTQIAAAEQDARLHEALDGIRERRKLWSEARRDARALLRAYRQESGKEWLPETLFALMTETEREPKPYKRLGQRLRWFDDQAEKIERLRKASANVLTSRSI
jgi:hypothetical protein